MPLPGLDHSNADVKLLTDGTLLVHTGGTDLGLFEVNEAAEVIANSLGVDLMHVDLSQVVNS